MLEYLTQFNKQFKNFTNDQVAHRTFLLRGIECRRSLAMSILSVCPSIKSVHCDKTDERSVQTFTPYER